MLTVSLLGLGAETAGSLDPLDSESGPIGELQVQ